MEPVVLLVHGANHDGWCWTPVLDRLARHGVRGRAVDLPLTSFDDDTAAVRAAVRQVADEAPVVLVAHSYGGLPASAGGHGAARFVYVAARMPVPGESPAGLTPQWNHPQFRADWEVREDGSVVLRPVAAELLYQLSPANLAELAMQRWRPMRSQVPSAPIPDPAWMSAPTAYVVCAQDRVVRVDAQRASAARAGTCYEIDCDHSPFFSAPDRLSRILAEQAELATPGERPRRRPDPR